jgi:tetratricopeptide (TPR) repeat protein
MNKSSGKTRRKNSKSPFWFYLILILIPILFFFLLEISLRIFDYGRNDAQWIQITETKQMLNPDVAGRYFYSIKDLPQSNNDAFDIVKRKNAYRVFVMGGSSAAGFPFSPNGTFSRYIRDRLELLYPNLHIEVINVAITATNSYTIRDLLPEVIEQKPDLILIYAGHNEYYGALGVGSAENIGYSTDVVNFFIWLNKFKTVQFIRTLLSSVGNIFSSEVINSAEKGGTLMARIVKEQLIPYNSESFDIGIKQFEENFEDILSITTEEKVPVIIGTLVSNLKDQQPFVIVENDKFESAGILYQRAQKYFNENDYPIADSLFRFAKDLDALRFRAPEKINTATKKLALKHKCGLVNVDSIFNSASQNGIVGNNLIVDHLHPSLSGYLFMGKIYFEAMRQNGLLPNDKPVEISDIKQDSIVINNFAFSRLDSIISEIRLIGLLNDWPFKESPDFSFVNNLQLNDKIDSLAYKTVIENLNWERAHREAATWYLEQEDYNNFAKEYNVLVSQYPFKLPDHDYAASQLINIKEFDLAYLFLNKRYKETPDAFSAKWIGNIKLNKGSIEEAIKFFLESIKYDNSDAQVFYNLAGAYIQKEDYKNAFKFIDKCIRLKPEFPNAQNLKKQLTNILHQ